MRIIEILILLTIWHQPRNVKSSQSTALSNREVDFTNTDFTCSSDGQFPDPTDATCTKYYLCLYYFPSYIAITRTCPNGTHFDPSIQQCTNYYNCETLTNECPTTVQNFTCSTEGRFADLNDFTCSNYFSCTLYGDSYVLTEQKCPDGYYFNREQSICDPYFACPCSAQTSLSVVMPSILSAYHDLNTDSSSVTTYNSERTRESCTINYDSEYFACNTEGIFLNLNDPKCQTYFHCNELQNGSYLLTLHSCPKLSKFNPTLQACDTNYVCPCEDITFTSENVTTSAIVTEITNPETTKESIGFIKLSVFSLNIAPSSEECFINYDPDYFSCSTTGRFPNLNDPTCQSYFLCNQLRNGSYLKTRYSCPTSSNFNPPLQICDASYICPCQVITDTSTESSQTTETDSLANIDTTDFTDIPEVTEASTTNTAAIISASTNPSSTEKCIINYDPDYFVCSTQGRFPNLNDPTCQTYFLCNLLRNGSYIRTKYSCPTTSYFNPPIQVCDTSYTCACQGKVTSTTEATNSSDFTAQSTKINPSDETTTQTASFSTSDTTDSSGATSYTESSDSAATTGSPSTVSIVTTSTPEGTTETCIYNSDPDYFVCSAQGRFPNLNDPTCQTYLLCNLLRNGSYIRTKYSCPTTSYFNPPIQVCDTNYTCGCQGKVSSTSEATNYPDSTDVTDSLNVTSSTKNNDSAETTSSPTPSTLPIVTTSTPEASPDECIYNSDPDYFVCSTQGRFHNLNDPTCQTYFLCNLLRNGSYIRTKYSCPTTSYFNPPIQVCDTSYTCACQGKVSSTTEATNYPDSTDVTDFLNVTSSTEKNDSVETTGSSSTVSTVTTPTPESTTETCIYNSDPDYFVCSTKGRFPNLNDPTCQTYFLCNLLRNGSYIRTKYSCPTTSYFNPPIQVCDTSYTCACQGKVSSTTEATNYPDSTDVTDSLNVTSSTEKNDSVETTGSSSTVSTVTTPTPESTTETCIYNSDPDYFVCSTKGRFPNLNDPTCQTYFLCNLLRNGSYIRTKYSCPTTSYFNPPIQVCDTSYTCACQEKATSTTEATNNPGVTTVSTEIDDSDETTTQTTTFSTSDTTDATGVTSSTENSGSAETTGSPSPVSTVTTPTPEGTTEACLINYDPDYFVCTTQGRFPNLNDPTCQTYFLCNLLRNGSYIRTKYSCPTTSYFNPPIQVCDTSYTCACQGKVSSTTEATHYPDSTDVTDSLDVTSSTENNDSSQTTSSPTPSTLPIVTTSTPEASPDECIYNSDPDYFVCSTQGRFPNLNDPTCQSYFLCNLLRNGSYIRTKYSCPTTSYFNPPIQVCDTSYTCACQRKVSSTTEATNYPDSTDVTESLDVTSSTENNDSAETTSSPTPSTLPIVTTSTPEASPDECIYNSDPDYLVCSTQGRFPNLNDPTCQTYFLCNLLRNGSYIRTKYSCPTTSYFNPPIQVCDTNYTCACQGKVTSATEATNSSEITTLSTGIDNSDETTTQITTVLISDTTDSTGVTSSPENSDSAETTGSPSPASTVITPTLEGNTETCIINSDPNYFVCTTQGRFPNLNDPTCQTYFLCNLLRNGSYIRTKYSCPTTSYFNPPIQVCDTNYTCACQGKVTSATESTNSSEIPTLPTGIDNSDETTTQTTTVSTSDTTDSTGVTSSTENSDSVGTTGSPSPVSTVTTPTPEGNTETCIINSDPNYFVCTTQGRFPNLNDPTCQTYFLCNLLRNGSYIRTQYSCPTKSYFNPSMQVCDTSYTCACQGKVSSTTEAANDPDSTDVTDSLNVTSSTENNDFAETTSSPIANTLPTVTTSTTGASSDKCIYNSDPDYLVCTTKGRFPNLNDPTCQTYFLCNLLRNGSYIRTKYSCPTTSYFNPTIQVCDKSYTCACQGKVTATTEAQLI